MGKEQKFIMWLISREESNPGFVMLSPESHLWGFGGSTALMLQSGSLVSKMPRWFHSHSKSFLILVIGFGRGNSPFVRVGTLEK